MDSGTFPPPPWLAHLLAPTVSPAAAPITFPTTPLKVKVMVALDADVTASPATWGWADATAMIYHRDAIHIERGRDDEASTADSQKLNLTGDNRSGHWSPSHPLSPWYGQLNMGSPIWVQVEGYSRYTGFISELPPRWDVSGNDRYAPIAARGLLYRLARGGSPARSALRRTISAATSPTPLHYWPLEEGTSASLGANVVAGGPPLDFQGDPLIGATGSAGSAGALDFGLGGYAEAQMDRVAATDTTFSFVGIWDPAAAGTVLRVDATLDAEVIISTTAGVLNATVLAAVGSTAFTGVAVDDGLPHHIAMTLHDNGIAVNAVLRVDGVAVDSHSVLSTWLQTARRVVLNPGGAVYGCLVEHFGIYTSLVTTDLSDAAAGYPDEQAHERAVRLCDEEGVLITCDGSRSIAMGPQGVESLIDLLRECEAADQAYLYEGVQWDLVFQTRAERYNLPAAVELDYTTPGHVSPPLEPTNDDQKARNDVEVKRDGGSSERVTEEDPAVARSIPRIGRRDESVTYNLADDSQLLNLASWRLHIGTTPGFRYPTLTVSLLAAPTLITTVCPAGMAYRLTVADPPLDVGAEPIDVMVEGYAEILELFGWNIAANCSPYRPNDVFQVVAGPANTSRIAPAGSTLDIAYGTGDASLAVTSPSTDARWVDSATYPLDFPIAIVIAGEPMTLTGVTGTTVNQTFAVTRGGSGFTKALPAGSLVEIQRPPAIAL